MEPPPKQGCEDVYVYNTRLRVVESQWNPRRSRGASALVGGISWLLTRLSGTPAEAGVRDGENTGGCLRGGVSVEPPPKQGCEDNETIDIASYAESQWNPRRSRGARILLQLVITSGATSQWNPRRSRGARWHVLHYSKTRAMSQWNPRRSRGASILILKMMKII